MTFPDGARPELVDWVDYQDRIDRADPADFAAEVLEHAGDDTIWFVTGSRLPNFEGVCEAVAAGLADGTPRCCRARHVDDDFFEFQGLTQFPPP